MAKPSAPPTVAGPPPSARPITSVDLAAFSLADDQLRVLLVRPTPFGASAADPWALPSSEIAIAQDADLQGCARRTALAILGKIPPYLEQLGSWGSADRDPRGWAATHVYLVPVFAEAAGSSGREGMVQAAWHPIRESTTGLRLALDHARILAAAVARLRNKAEYTSVVAHMLPDEFTLPDLQHAYEVVLERPMDKSAFRTRMLSGTLLQPLNRYREGLRRPAMLYRLKTRRSIVHFPRSLQAKA